MKIGDKVQTKYTQQGIAPNMTGEIYELNDTEAFVNFDNGEGLYLKISVLEVVEEESSYGSTSDYTREEFYKELQIKLEDYFAFIEKNYKCKEEQLIAVVYKEPKNSLMRFLYNHLEFTDKDYEYIKKSIHLSSSLITNTSSRLSLKDTELSEILFGFLYSFLDVLQEYEDWGYAKL